MPSFTNKHPHNQHISKLSKVENAIAKLQKITENQPSTFKEPDELDIFGKNIAVQFLTLPLQTNLTLQEKIQSMITNEGLKQLEQPQHLQ